MLVDDVVGNKTDERESGGGRKRNKIVSTSALDIKVAEQDLYIAEVGGRLLVKLGGRMDMGSDEVKEGDGWKFALSGKNFAIWEREAAKVRPFVCFPATCTVSDEVESACRCLSLQHADAVFRNMEILFSATRICQIFPIVFPNCRVFY